MMNLFIWNICVYVNLSQCKHHWCPALNMHTWWILYSEMAPRGLASSFCPLATFMGAYYFGKSLTRISVFHILKGSKNIINWLANVYLWLLRCEVKIHGHKEQHHSRHWCHKQLVMYIAGVKRYLGQLMGRLRVNLRFQYNNLKGPSVILVDVERSTASRLTVLPSVTDVLDHKKNDYFFTDADCCRRSG